MENKCFYCRQNIGIEDVRKQLESGVLHIHYCTQCIQFCESCQTLKTIYAFAYDQNTEEYRLWQGNNCLPHPAPPKAHKKICSECERDNFKKAQRAQYELKRARLESPSNKRMIEAMRQRLRERTGASVRAEEGG